MIAKVAVGDSGFRRVLWLRSPLARIQVGLSPMLRVSLGNYGFGNREQAAHQGIECLKFLRWTCHVVSMIALCVLADSAPFWNSSLAAKSHSREAAEQKDETAQPAPTTPTAIGQISTAIKEQAANQEPYQWPDTKLLQWIRRVAGRVVRWGLTSSPADWLLVVIGAGGVWAALRTLKSIEEQTAANVDEARATKTAAEAAKTSADAVMLAERAYVILSHESPWLNPNTWYWTPIWIQVQNRGRTPADILGGFIGARIGGEDEIPTGFDVNRPVGQIPPQFLVPSDSGRFQFSVPVSQKELNDINFRTDNSQLWLIGYVDYRDRFGCEHRAGYARRLNPVTADLISDDTTALLNYDRPLKPEERHDYK